MSELTTLPLRSRVPVEQTWNLASIYPTPADWENACKELSDQLPGLAAYQNRLSESPQTLLAFMDLYQQAGTLIGKIFTYAMNASAVDTGDQATAARAGQARSLYARFATAVAFLDPELVGIGFERLRQWMGEIPELAFLAHYVDRLEHRGN